MKRIDTRGTSCPQPVLMTKNSIDPGTNKVEVVVDNTASLNNVIRFLKQSGFSSIETNACGEDTVIAASR